MFRVAKHLMRAASPSTDDSIEVSESDGIRALHLGSVTIQSAMRIKDPFALALKYTRAMMCFLLFNEDVKAVLIIGLGGGSLPKYLHAFCASIHTTVLEINPKMIQVARHQFCVPDNDARLTVIEGDGLQYLAENENTADVLLIDAFDSHGIPANFCSQDFFDQCAASLNNVGIFAINLWQSDKNFDVYLQRIEQSFNGNALILPTGKPGNIAVFGFKRVPHDCRIARLRERAKALQDTHNIEFLDFVETLAEHNPSNGHRIFFKSES